jgi:murein DD-endopeptidase MepM/ murein hydrolase activator NlpD
VCKFSKKTHTAKQYSPISSRNYTILIRILFAILLAAVIFGPGAAADTVESQQVATDNNSPPVTLSPNPAANGNVVLLEIDTRSLDQPVFGLQIKFHEKMITLASHPSKAKGVYFGLMGIPYHITPGSTAFKLEWTNRYGYHSKIVRFTVNPGKFRSEKLKVKNRMVEPNKDDRQRSLKERDEVKKAYLISSSDRLWPGMFQLPVEGKVTSPYGTRRLMNDKFKKYHSGVDFRANEDTPIHAANAGIVKLAKNLFYSGNHVILDHGLGLFTNYSHLSKIHVIPGQRVEKGQVIGYAGSTGRVNGPHLHWGAKVNGTSVDPLQLLKVLTSLLNESPEKL